MTNYENLLKQVIERYFYDEIYDTVFKDIKVTSEGINRIVKTLLNDDEFLSDLDFLIFDRIVKEPFWIESDGEKFI